MWIFLVNYRADSGKPNSYISSTTYMINDCLSKELEDWKTLGGLFVVFSSYVRWRGEVRFQSTLSFHEIMWLYDAEIEFWKFLKHG